MRKDFKAQNYLYPLPVLIIGTYDENAEPNAMTAAWGGFSDYNQIAISLSEHKTTSNLRFSKAFTVSIGTVKTVKMCDYVGIVSQNDDAEKMEKAHFSTTRSKNVLAPLINELPMALECEVVELDEVKGILIGKIVNISCDESILSNGKIDVKKLDPISYDPVNNKYIRLGDIVGNAFEDGLELK